MAPSLNVTHLIKRFNRFQLGPIDLELRAGQALGLLGPNGAGKSTLLSCIAGQLTPEEGTVTWNKSPITRGNWKLREFVTFVPERHTPYKELSVSKTLLFCSKLFKSWDPVFVSKWKERFNLEGDKKVGKLSKGMLAKLQILIGLAHGSKLLLLDEPTAGLDPDSRIELQKHISTLISEKNTCAIISSHLFDDIEGTATLVRIIRDGVTVFHASLNEIEKMKLYTSPNAPFPVQTTKLKSFLQPWHSNGNYYLLASQEDDANINEFVSQSGVVLKAENVTLERIYFLSQRRNGV